MNRQRFCDDGPCPSTQFERELLMHCPQLQLKPGQQDTLMCELEDGSTVRAGWDDEGQTASYFLPKVGTARDCRSANLHLSEQLFLWRSNELLPLLVGHTINQTIVQLPVILDIFCRVCRRMASRRSSTRKAAGCCVCRDPALSGGGEQNLHAYVKKHCARYVLSRHRAEGCTESSSWHAATVRQDNAHISHCISGALLRELQMGPALTALTSLSSETAQEHQCLRGRPQPVSRDH